MMIAHEVSHFFDRKTGRGSFELVGVETDTDGRFVALGAFGQFHYSHENDYAGVRRQAEADTIRRLQQIRAFEGRLAGEGGAR
jgi:hypothetical protein